MTFDWNAVIHAVVSLLAVLGVPGLLVATIWSFLDEHPFVGAFLSVITLALIGFLCGLPEEMVL